MPAISSRKTAVSGRLMKYVIGMNARRSAAQLMSVWLGVEDDLRRRPGLLADPVDRDEQDEHGGDDPQQRARALVEAAQARERPALGDPAAALAPREHDQRHRGDRQRQRVRERAHAEEDRQQPGRPAAVARRLARPHQPPRQHEREGHRHVPPRLVEVGVEAGVQDHAVGAREAHRARRHADARAEQVARDQVHPERRAAPAAARPAGRASATSPGPRPARRPRTRSRSGTWTSTAAA